MWSDRDRVNAEVRAVANAHIAELQAQAEKLDLASSRENLPWREPRRLSDHGRFEPWGSLRAARAGPQGFEITRTHTGVGFRRDDFTNCGEKDQLAKGLGHSTLDLMMNLLTRTMRFKAAAFMAVLYALIVLAPHAAMAFAGPNAAVHCLTEQSSMSGHDHVRTAHVHADGTTNAHDEGKKSPDGSDEQGPAAACCGLFSTSAMVSETRSVVPGPVMATTVQARLPDLIVGQGPDRINRPPIA